MDVPEQGWVTVHESWSLLLLGLRASCAVVTESGFCLFFLRLLLGAMFFVGWRHARRSEWPFITIITVFLLLLFNTYFLLIFYYHRH